MANGGNYKPVLRMHASHGYAVAELSKHVEQFQLDLQYMSAEEALASFSRGQCDIAGFHLPTEYLSEPLYQNYRRYLKPRAHKLIRFITRQQGLMVRPENPAQIEALEDLAGDNVRFINRQKDSGTRALLDELLRRYRLNSNDIDGFTTEEFTHSAVAAHVAAGMADVGFGVQAAAAQFGLKFIPLAQEQYWLVCRNDAVMQEALQRFLRLIRSEQFHQAVANLAGYSEQGCGQLVDLEAVFDR